VPVEIIRGGKRQTLTVTVGQRPTEEELAKQIGGDTDQGTDQDNTPATPGSAVLGLSLQTLTPQISRALNLPTGSRGVVITAVDPNSDASDKGLQRGDLVVSVNQQLVTTPAQVQAAVDAARRAGRTNVLLLVKRGTAPEAFVGIEISNAQR
jgi:serine protease Do